MTDRRPRRERPPLNPGTLNELALRYVGRFATSRAKLRTYLTRKLRERGWSGEADPDLAALTERFTAQGYIDDAGYALSKSRTLSGRGYGKARLVQSLRVAGIEEADAVEARRHADAEAVQAAVRLAKRKRIGPFAGTTPDPQERQRALAAMVRGGHSFALSRALVDTPPNGQIDENALADLISYSED
jgi:regulatory protein